jgi:hypothetical protein
MQTDIKSENENTGVVFARSGMLLSLVGVLIHEALRFYGLNRRSPYFCGFGA